MWLAHVTSRNASSIESASTSGGLADHRRRRPNDVLRQGRRRGREARRAARRSARSRACVPPSAPGRAALGRRAGHRNEAARARRRDRRRCRGARRSRADRDPRPCARPPPVRARPQPRAPARADAPAPPLAGRTARPPPLVDVARRDRRGRPPRSSSRFRSTAALTPISMRPWTRCAAASGPVPSRPPCCSAEISAPRCRCGRLRRPRASGRRAITGGSSRHAGHRGGGTIRK